MSEQHLHGYPSIRALGHRDIEDIFAGPVLIEEKVDGSQFSFGVTLDTGELIMRSKGAVLYDHAASSAMFSQGMIEVRRVEHLLHPGWTYRGEYLAKPKHNTLAYDRIPLNHVALFDVETDAGQHYLMEEEKAAEAERLGFDIVPSLYFGEADLTRILDLLDTDSFLGGQKIEGVVIKNYDVFTRDGKVAMGKYVSERFKEVHQGDWRDRNPNRADIITRIIDGLKTPARWNKGVQHLRERGELQEAPQDIGPLIREVTTDILAEEKGAISEALFEAFWKDISRGVTAGLPEWYKQQLLEAAFAPETVAS